MSRAREAISANAISGLSRIGAVDPLFSSEVTQICAAVVNFSLAMLIEGCQRWPPSLILVCRQATAADALVQHIALRKALHFDQPVDDAVAAAEG